ncbi:MAG TPA: efflux RND transporter periplasmic adaptor subunit [Polyangiales bacterium]
MSDTLSSDLASLKIDRDARPARGGPLRALVIVGLLAGLGFVGYQKAKPYLEAELFKTDVELTEVTVVSPAAASTELTSTGYVVPQLRSQVGAKEPGRVAKVFVREGATVKAGQLLLELDRADKLAAMQSARMRAASARARVATAHANLEEVGKQAQRQRALAERGAAPAAQADDLASRVVALGEQVKAAEAEVGASEAEVEALRVSLGNLSVVSPINGTVLNKPPEAGELVGPDPGLRGGTIELADFSSILVETDVPEARLHLVKIGSPCEIVLDAYPTKRFRGEAAEIMPRVNRAKATVGVKVKFVDDSAGVLPDMSARVSFLNKALDDANLQQQPKTVVPAEAIVTRAGAKVVFAVDGETAHMRPVTLGPAYGSDFELMNGPEPGTKLVKSPPATLRDGQKVKEKTAS